MFCPRVGSAVLKEKKKSTTGNPFLGKTYMELAWGGVWGPKRVNALTTGTPLLGTHILEVSIGRDVRTLVGSSFSACVDTKRVCLSVAD